MLRDRAQDKNLFSYELHPSKGCATFQEVSASSDRRQTFEVLSPQADPSRRHTACLLIGSRAATESKDTSKHWPLTPTQIAEPSYGRACTRTGGRGSPGARPPQP